MRVLVTGAEGFIGKNLIERLRSEECPEVSEVFEFTLDSGESLLESYCAECDFVVHLAGVNRPLDPAEFAQEILFRAGLEDALVGSGLAGLGGRGCG